MEAIDGSQSSYDEIPYPSFVFRESHPDRLASIAALFGMKSPALATASVLELGCASGANLVPIALGLPKARCVGIDLSSKQIEAAQRFAKDSGAKNVEFRTMDLKNVGADFGTFDYIICHGVFSWVPAELQSKILEICSKNLTAAGVAYVSYNTLPGWNMYRSIRDMMLYHTGQFAEPALKVQQARAFLNFAARAVSHQNSAYSLLLKTELLRLQREPDAYLLHDHLEAQNNPIYFHDFISQAEAQGLRYLGEAAFHSMAMHEFPRDVQETLRGLTDKIVSMEQYVDFLRNRTFRATLLCHKDIKLNRRIEPSAIKPFYFASALRAVNEASNPLGEGEESYRQADGTEIRTSDRTAKVVITCLAEVWPQRLPIDKLLQSARAKMSRLKGAEVSEQNYMEVLLQLIHQGVVEFNLLPPNFVTSVSSRPVVSTLARLQCSTGLDVTNQRHERVPLPDLYRQLGALCDGTRDKSALARSIEELLEKGTLKVREGRSIPAPGPARQDYFRKTIEAGLASLARMALLTQ